MIYLTLFLVTCLLILSPLVNASACEQLTVTPSISVRASNDSTVSDAVLEELYSNRFVLIQWLTIGNTHTLYSRTSLTPMLFSSWSVPVHLFDFDDTAAPRQSNLLLLNQPERSLFFYTHYASAFFFVFTDGRCTLRETPTPTQLGGLGPIRVLTTNYWTQSDSVHVYYSRADIGGIHRVKMRKTTYPYEWDAAIIIQASNSLYSLPIEPFTPLQCYQDFDITVFAQVGEVSGNNETIVVSQIRAHSSIQEGVQTPYTLHTLNGDDAIVTSDAERAKGGALTAACKLLNGFVINAWRPYSGNRLIVSLRDTMFSAPTFRDVVHARGPIAYDVNGRFVLTYFVNETDEVRFEFEDSLLEWVDGSELLATDVDIYGPRFVRSYAEGMLHGYRSLGGDFLLQAVCFPDLIVPTRAPTGPGHPVPTDAPTLQPSASPSSSESAPSLQPTQAPVEPNQTTPTLSPGHSMAVSSTNTGAGGSTALIGEPTGNTTRMDDGAVVAIVATLLVCCLLLGSAAIFLMFSRPKRRERRQRRNTDDSGAAQMHSPRSPRSTQSARSHKRKSMSRRSVHSVAPLGTLSTDYANMPTLGDYSVLPTISGASGGGDNGSGSQPKYEVAELGVADAGSADTHIYSEVNVRPDPIIGVYKSEDN